MEPGAGRVICLVLAADCEERPAGGMEARPVRLARAGFRLPTGLATCRTRKETPP